MNDGSVSQRVRTRAELMGLILETAHEAFVSMEADGRITEWNPAAEATFGWSRSEVVGHELAATIIPERFREAHRQGLKRFLETGEARLLNRRFEASALHRDGREFPVEITIAPVAAEDGHAFNAFLHDISERKRLEWYLTAQNAVNRVLLAPAETVDATMIALLQALGESLEWELGAFWRVDEDAQALRCEHVWSDPAVAADSFAELSRQTAFAPGEGLPGQVWESGEPRWVADVREQPDSALAGAAVEAGLHAAICLPVRGDGRVLAVLEFFSRAPRQPDPQLLELYDQVSDHVGLYLARKRAEGELAYRALHDDLTGLPNRNLLFDRIGHALEVSKRLSSRVAVLYFDLDNFKDVNDGFGHAAGDALLEQVVARVKSLLRSSDTTARLGGETVARLGGDEFAVLCEGVENEQDAIRIAERLRQGLAEPFEASGHRLNVTASIGVALPGGPDADPDSLVRDADIAMGRAKEDGGDRCELFDETMREQVLERLDTENQLRGAAERGELALHYQPIVAVTDGNVVGVEALARWNHPQRGLLEADEFIPLAEEIGLILPIGTWVLNEACRQATEWGRDHPDWPPLRISVNVSARQLTADFLDTVFAILDQTGIDPRRLVLEITESVVVENPDSAGMVGKLRERGIRLALDDFGTGYSSVSYLASFPLDVLKVDRSLISMVDENPQVCRVTAAAIEMGRALGMSVIGEGIEKEAQLERLRDLGCHYAQGFLFSPPQPPEEIARLLDECFQLGTAPRVSAAG